MANIASDPAFAKGKRGGKLNRTETVTVRLDPKLNYLLDLAARANRRTKSSFIEWAIEEALGTAGIPGESKGAGSLWTIADRKTDLWDVDEPDRLAKLAYFAPSLLTHDEQLVWKVISTSPYLWRGNYYEDGDKEVWGYDPTDLSKLIMDRLRDNWDAINQVAEGEADRAEHWQLKTRLVKGETLWTSTGGGSGSNYDDLDDDLDVPF